MAVDKILSPPLKKEHGIATIEATLLLTIFVVFMTYCVGMFGVIHTGILNSISARAYSFETFRNRTNVIYFRDQSPDNLTRYDYGIRLHGIVAEGSDGDSFFVTERTLAQGNELDEVQRRPANQADALNYKKRESGSVNPVWIKTTYGICLNANCGKNGGS